MAEKPKGKKDVFDQFLDKQFGQGPKVRIAQPVGGSRSTTFEERRSPQGAPSGGEVAQAAAVEPVAAAPVVGGAGAQGAPVSGPASAPAPAEAEPAVGEEGARRGPGRPRAGKDLFNMNFLIERELKTKLELLKIELYRSSVTDLMKEAIHDLLVKYGKA